MLIFAPKSVFPSVKTLKDLNIPIYFEKEKIDTSKMEGELLLTLLGSMAEEESVSISQNNKWAIKKRFQDGTYKLSNAPFGYHWDGERLVVNEEEAETVRWIFEEVGRGVLVKEVSDTLNAKGVLTARGNAWTPQAIRTLVANERYVGDALLQKKYTDSQFRRHINYGEVPQYLITDHHEAIVSREVFEAANKAIEQRRMEKNIEAGSHKYQQRYIFSGKIICGECGKVFKRRMQYGYTAWWCSGHIKDRDSCDMKFVREKSVERAFTEMVGDERFFKMVTTYYKEVRSSASDGSISSSVYISEIPAAEDKLHRRLVELNTRQVVLFDLLKKGLIDHGLYHKERTRLTAEFDSVQKQLHDIQGKTNKQSEKIAETRTLLRLLKKRGASKNGSVDETTCLDPAPAEAANDSIAESSVDMDIAVPNTAETSGIHSFDSDLFTTIVDHIRVDARDEITFVLKCGLEATTKLG